jgi:hypothetical protein
MCDKLSIKKLIFVYLFLCLFVNFQTEKNIQFSIKILVW